jgi:Excalibur calcium-binding domain
VAILVTIGPFAGAALAQTDRDCGDFPYREGAQAVLDQDRADPDDLDRDKDGLACEELPYRGTASAPASVSPVPTGHPTAPVTMPPASTVKPIAPSSVSPAPVGAVHAGEGGTSRPADFTRPLGLGLVGISLTAAGAAALARRRTARR